MLKILHVDRSELFRKVMRELIARCGHSIVSVSSKAEGLAARRKLL
jgi:two-component system cell cycle response regulator